MNAETVLVIGTAAALAVIVVWGVVAGRRHKAARPAAPAAHAHGAHGTGGESAPHAPAAVISPAARPLLEKLRDGATRPAAMEEIAARGPAIVPDLLAALEGPAFASQSEDPGTVRAALLVSISRIGDPAAAPRLLSMMRARSCGDVDPLGTLASLGTDDAIAPLRAALGAPSACAAGCCGSGDPAAEALQGVALAGVRGRATPAFREAMVPVLLGLVGRRAGRSGPTPSEVLVALDREAAARVLVSDAVLAGGGVAVQEAFTALADARVPVDADVVMHVFESLPVRHPETAAEAATLTAILRLLAASGHPKARTVIEAARASGHEASVRAARAALITLEGVEHADHFVAERAERSGPAALSHPQIVLLLVRAFLAASGHAEFLASPLGGRPGDVESALREIGAVGTADGLAQAISRFRGGLPTDEAERRRRIEEATSAGRAPFQDVDERLWHDAAAIEDRIADYVVAHAAQFRPEAPRAVVSLGASA